LHLAREESNETGYRLKVLTDSGFIERQKTVGISEEAN
jgi:hypothetical protein